MKTLDVAILGGGVTGLAAAHRAIELGATNVRVFEASDQVGGLIRSERTPDGFLIEHGPESFITDKPWAVALAKRLGIEDQLIQTQANARRALVVRRGRLEPIPVGFELLAPTRIRDFIRSPVLSPMGKARALLDIVLPSQEREDESLASFVRRRLGNEVFERLAQPLAGGIYGANPEMLSVHSSLPRFVEAEQQFGSVIRGLRDRARKRMSGTTGGPGVDRTIAAGARYGLFTTFANGMQTLTDALGRSVGERVSTHSQVVALRRMPTASPAGETWRLALMTRTGLETVDARRVIVALPAHRAGELLAHSDSGLSEELRAIPYGSGAAVTLAYRRDQIHASLNASGFVVPEVEGLAVIACTWSSVKWNARAPHEHVLLRAFLPGDAVTRGVADDDLIEAARRDVSRLMRITGAPIFAQLDRWVRSMPHYIVGHDARVTRIRGRAQALTGLALAGNAYDGVGIPDSVRSGETAAAHVTRT